MIKYRKFKKFTIYAHPFYCLCMWSIAIVASFGGSLLNILTRIIFIVRYFSPDGRILAQGVVK